MTLREKKCVPCEGGTMPLTIPAAEALMQEVEGWTLAPDARKISREFSFKNFAEALAFANKIGAIAEEEGHHPDLTVKWGRVGVELSTHAIGGLSENDFILASKIDALV
ncbi:MAG TPA: 4a-hydroxytetrahydrobiopterin dehydratase [Candidatus Paceibacterota bacterium]|nr:4a-hydroxytetrahydrobiopterin dehydratase [Candidatus Paceibacterota bacterium]